MVDTAFPVFPVAYEGRVFRAVSNSVSGEVSGDTVFWYRQEGDVVWAEYSGGDVIKGFLVGTAAPDGRLEFSYQHVNRNKAVRIGACSTVPEVLPDGRLRLHEEWRWLNGGCESGRSVLEERYDVKDI